MRGFSVLRSDRDTRYSSYLAPDVAVIGPGTGPATIAVDDKTVWTLAVPGGQVWDAADRAAVDARYYIAGPEAFVALLDVAVAGTHVEPDGLQAFRAAVSMLAGEAVDVVSIQGTGGPPPQMTIQVRSSQGHAFDLSLIVFGTKDRAWPPGVRRTPDSELAKVEAVLGPLRRATS